jgi:aryl-alcohol dehydrogenase-like predicted oxidoreductase
VSVSKLCFGAGMFGYFGNEDQNECDRMVHRALDAGINYFDTSDVYSHGESETMLGRALAGRRDDVVLATKFGLPMSDDPGHRGNSRRWIMREVEASLRRLGTDYIDLYQIHRTDPYTDIEETLRALDDLVRQGKVRYIGCSNLPAWQLMKALAVSDGSGLERFQCTQSYYSLVGRELEQDVIPLIEDQGLGLLVWSPLAGGFLSGKFTRKNEGEGRRKTFDFPPVDKEKGYDVVDVLLRVAKRHGVSAARVGLAWVLASDAVTSVIIGARNLRQLDDNIEAVDLELTADDLKALDDVSRIAPGYPAWMDVLGSDRRPGEVRRLQAAQSGAAQSSGNGAERKSKPKGKAKGKKRGKAAKKR